MNKNHVADRMKSIPFSGIRKVFEEVNQLTSQGKDIINLCIGRPNFDTPKHIKEAAKQALDQQLVHYTSNYGLEELREAICQKLQRDNSLSVSPSEVIVTVGAGEAISIAMTAVLDPGDEVIIPNPTWPHYRAVANLIGAIPVDAPLKEENNFVLHPDDLQKIITPKTKMLVLNTPTNPAGSIYDEEALKAIADIAIENDIIVLSDEIYEYLIYEGKHISTATLPGMKNRTITVNGFSKAYSMTGWRLGYVTAGPEIMSAMIRVHQYTVTCATSFAQAGGIAALTGSQECVVSMRQAFDSRRKMVVSRLESIPGVSCANPRGAFYAFPGIKELGLSSEEAARRLLDNGVAVVPGTAFGPNGAGYFRISFASSYEILEQAMDKIEETFKG